MEISIVADSGSTKCDWAVISGEHVEYISGPGLNPYQKSWDEIKGSIQLVRESIPNDSFVKEIQFYGSGCNEAMIPLMAGVLVETFNCSKVLVNSDLMGAALSVFDGEKCIVSILGTGSNACVYDGEKIDFIHPSLGYVLGDEGSGNQIGKELLKAFYYETMPEELRKDFSRHYQVDDLTVVLHALYHQSSPSVYLASFAPWALSNIQNDWVNHLLKKCLQHFIHDQLIGFSHSGLPCHFVGSIAYICREILSELLTNSGLKPGNFVKNPLNEIVLKLQNQNL